MQRRYEFVDLVIAIGVFATIVAGGLLFMAANGTLSLSPSRLSEREQPIGTVDGMRRLQPVLGQAIVDHDLLGRVGEVLAFSMAGESDAEKRRLIVPVDGVIPPTDVGDEVTQRQAA
jgi:hypothetical protein